MEPIEAQDLAEHVDAYKALRDMRLAEQKKVDELKSQETLLKHRILGSLDHAKMSACGGQTHTASLVKKVEPVLEEPELLEAHIQATGEFDLLQRRISPVAIRNRWDLGLEVPGIGKIDTVNLSLTKNK